MFGEQCGQVRDVPENTTPNFKMVMIRPAFAITDFDGLEMSTKPPLNTYCEFEWDGKIEAETGARCYQLIDIYKS